MGIPSYFSSDKKHKKSKKQEGRVAEKLGGKRQKGSGSVPLNKGDVRSEHLLTECKRTDKKSISIKIDYLEKITNEAISYGCTPSLAIEFENTPRIVEKDWIMIPSSFLTELMALYEEHREEQCDQG